MILCRITGTVHATAQNAHLAGHRILIAEPVNLRNESAGLAILAVDAVDAGEGDLVIVNREGGAARILLRDEEIPVQAVVVAVVDALDTTPETSGP